MTRAIHTTRIISVDRDDDTLKNKLDILFNFTKVIPVSVAQALRTESQEKMNF